jgi:hypothetical protein
MDQTSQVRSSTEGKLSDSQAKHSLSYGSKDSQCQKSYSNIYENVMGSKQVHSIYGTTARPRKKTTAPKNPQKITETQVPVTMISGMLEIVGNTQEIKSPTINNPAPREPLSRDPEPKIITPQPKEIMSGFPEPPREFQRTPYTNMLPIKASETRTFPTRNSEERVLATRTPEPKIINSRKIESAVLVPNNQPDSRVLATSTPKLRISSENIPKNIVVSPDNKDNGINSKTGIRAFFSRQKKDSIDEKPKTHLWRPRSSSKYKVSRSMSDAQDFLKQDEGFAGKLLLRTKSCHRVLMPSMLNKSHDVSFYIFKYKRR